MPLFSEKGSATILEPLPFAEWQQRPAWPAVSLANTDPVEDAGAACRRGSPDRAQLPQVQRRPGLQPGPPAARRLGYAGELRATGGVLQDQVPFMLRCGFNSFESDQKGFGEALAKARTLFSVVYQPAEDDRAPRPRCCD